uniref:Uncharacterized protein n=1 Tax=Amphimedon queenslandica TaxID=400682 RepID=A0A1X7SY82_AMPQE
MTTDNFTSLLKGEQITSKASGIELVKVEDIPQCNNFLNKSDFDNKNPCYGLKSEISGIQIIVCPNVIQNML